LGEWYGVPLVVHCWADMQSVNGFRCYDNIAPNAKCQRVLIVALCLVQFSSVTETQSVYFPLLSIFIINNDLYSVMIIL